MDDQSVRRVSLGRPELAATGLVEGPMIGENECIGCGDRPSCAVLKDCISNDEMVTCELTSPAAVRTSFLKAPRLKTLQSSLLHVGVHEVVVAHSLCQIDKCEDVFGLQPVVKVLQETPSNRPTVLGENSKEDDLEYQNCHSQVLQSASL